MIWCIREVAIMESLIAKGQLLEVEYKMAPKMDLMCNTHCLQNGETISGQNILIQFVKCCTQIRLYSTDN